MKRETTMSRAISSSRKDRLQIGRLKGISEGGSVGHLVQAFACRATGRAVIGGCEEKRFAKSGRLVHTLSLPFPSPPAPTHSPPSPRHLSRSLRAQGTPSVGGLRCRDGRCQDAGAEQRLSRGRVRGGRRWQEFPRAAFRERILSRVLHTDHRGYLQTGKCESATAPA